MNSLTNYAERRLLDAANGVAAIATGNRFVALFTADPTETGSTAAEVTGGGYARQALPIAAAATDGSNGTSATTTADIIFPDMPACVVTHVGILDAVTGGNMWQKEALVQAQTVNNGNPFRFDTGNLTTKLD